jgi:hypothetical protein
MSSLKKHVIAPEKPLRAKLITLLIAALPAVAVWFYFTEISTVTTDALTKIEREQSICFIT